MKDARKSLKTLVRRAGLEPATHGLKDGGSGRAEILLLKSEARHSYKIIYTAISAVPAKAPNSFRIMVGPRGFEPRTSCTPSKRASQAAPRPDREKLLRSYHAARRSQRDVAVLLARHRVGLAV